MFLLYRIFQRVCCKLFFSAAGCIRTMRTTFQIFFVKYPRIIPLPDEIKMERGECAWRLRENFAKSSLFILFNCTMKIYDRNAIIMLYTQGAYTHISNPHISNFSLTNNHRVVVIVMKRILLEIHNNVAKSIQWLRGFEVGPRILLPGRL